MADGKIVIETELKTDKLKARLAGLNADIEKQTKKVAELSRAYEAAQKTAQTQAQGLGFVTPETEQRVDAARIALEKAQGTLDKMTASLSEQEQKAETLANQYKMWQGLAKGEVEKTGSVNPVTQEEMNKDLLALEKVQARIQEMNADLERQTVKVQELARSYEEMQRAADIEANGTGIITPEAQANIDRAKIELDKAQATLQRMQADAAGVGNQLEHVGEGAEDAETSLDRAAKSMDAFVNRITRLAQRVFVFSLITSALRQFRAYLSATLQANDEFQSALARTKGALLTAFQPIWATIVPWLITLLNLITRVVSAIARLFAFFSGKSVSDNAKSAKAMYNEANAIGAVGGAAKKASKELASFDTINKLSDSSGGGGGGGGGGASMPDFSGLDEANEKLDHMLVIIGAIGAGLLAWKLAKKFGADMQTALGLALAVAGAVLMVYDYLYMWNNGIDTKHLAEALGALLLIVGGLYMAFGSVAAGIALVVGGLALLVLGVRDAVKNGVKLENQLLIIAAILTAGVGIGILTGSWIPALIAGFLAILVALANLTGNGEKLMKGLWDIFDGFIKFFTGIFTGDFEKAAEGIKQIMTGLKDTADALIDTIVDSINGFLDWLDEITGGKITPFFEGLKGFITGIGETLKGVLNGIIDFLTGVFTGDWEGAWEGVKGIFKSIWNGIISLLESAINFVIDGLNKISFDVPSWVPIAGGQHFGFNLNRKSLPRLAEGAVIPPNREFLAMLGDQTSGTNIETPLSTMVQAFRMALQEYAGQEAVLVVDGQTAGRIFYPLINAESRRIGTSLTEG